MKFIIDLLFINLLVLFKKSIWNDDIFSESSIDKRLKLGITIDFSALQYRSFSALFLLLSTPLSLKVNMFKFFFFAFALMMMTFEIRMQMAMITQEKGELTT